jgi:hypothetical protein
MPHMICGSATFYSFRSAHRLRNREQNNLRTDPEPQHFPAPVTKYNITGIKTRKIIPDPHPVQDPVAAAPFLHTCIYTVDLGSLAQFDTDGVH